MERFFKHMTDQLLIFDLDGTLIDSRADLAAGINHMRSTFELEPLPLETVSSYIGNGVRKLVERSLEGSGVDIEEALQINIAYYFSHLTDHTTLYPGVEAGIQQLYDAGHQLAVLTNKPGEPSRQIMQYFELEGFFAAIIGGGDIANLKPEPDGIYTCLKSAECVASSAWMIGDHYTDLAAGKNAGVKSAFVQYGFGEERGCKPDAYFASFSELVEYFV
jgi:phosphoglycolate phosphatase